MRTLIGTVVAVLAFVVTVPGQQAVRRFSFDDFSRLKRVADPQFSPDGSSLAVLISAPNLDENRHVASLHTVDVASGTLHVIVSGEKAIAVSFPRWSPNGQQIAYLATVPTAGQPKPQVFVVSSRGGASKQITTAPSGVQQMAWSPDSRTIGFATADEAEKKPGYQRWNDSFDVQLNDHFLTSASLPPTHVWMVPADGGEMKRLTSGTWTLPVTRPPGAPSSMITWTPDGAGILFNRSGGGGGGGGAGGAGGGLQIVSIADGTIKPLAGANGTHPAYSPNKDMVAFLAGGNAAVLPLAPAPAEAPVQPRQLTQAIDRGIARVLWMPDGKSVIVGANDDERVSLWQVAARRPSEEARHRRRQSELVLLRRHGDQQERRDRVHRHVARTAGGALLQGVARRAGAAAHDGKRRDRVDSPRQDGSREVHERFVRAERDSHVSRRTSTRRRSIRWCC